MSTQRREALETVFSDSDYAQLSSLPLDAKVAYAEKVIRAWYNHYSGDVYVSFSGGKASTVLLDIARSLYPDIPAVFVDSYQEYPEVRTFALSTPGIIVLHPAKDFRRIIAECGYPIVSKRIARVVRFAQGGSAWALNWLDNRFASGEPRVVGRMDKWKYLVDAPFKVSDNCCYYTKHQPIAAYEKETGLHPFLGLQASESYSRLQSWKKYGCNSYDSMTATSNPLSIWKDTDIWEYIKVRKLPYCTLYDMGYKRTGCCFCMFGVHLEKEPNRFQLMKRTHPVLYDYCMRSSTDGGLGLHDVLEYIGVRC